MIFQQLILHNFGLYGGQHVIDLATTNTKKNIVLVGGLNGRGKTTLLDAIRLALYGHRAPCSNRGTLSYPDFLNQCIHRHTSKQETAIHLIFHHTLNRSLTEFRICRSWTGPVKNSRDTLTIYVDGKSSSDWSNNWDDRIEAIFPLGISNLFLFDGEQVKELAEHDNLPPAVIQAMQSLLGLELPDRLSTDLEVLQRRKQKQISGKQQLQKLEELEQRLQELKQLKKAAFDEQASLKNRLDWAEKQLRLAEEKFLTEGGKIAAEEQSLQVKLDYLRQQAEGHRQTLRKLAAGSLPLALIKPLLQQAKDQSQQELDQQQQVIAHDLLTNHNRCLLEYLHDLNLPQKYLSPIQAFLSHSSTHLSTHSFISYLAPTSDLPLSLGHLLTHLLPTQQQQAQAEIQKIHDIQSEIDSTERYVASAASPEAYGKLQKAVRQAQTELGRLRANYEQAHRQHEQVKQVIAQTHNELLSYSQLAIEFKNTNHVIEAIAKAQTTLVEFKQRLKERKLSHLGNFATECLHELLSKKDLVEQIQINPQTFAIQLFDKNYQPLQKHRLSAGEKQLLAIALLWGLARASGRQLPVAIDTPLGRLDSQHRKKLVDHYFPKASHQVILLSTDTEIRFEEVERLRAQGAIASEYLLKYDDTQQCTQINSGYFW
ncbi:DNA sulfur modification protein DndD [Trichocoleus sp. FACHB-591]|uniref:DNA sulfur modification protein DndD n=1 Tax=Trichocoleus sp. FACHB-591 TaxID=2692872 RepID=UPI001688D248|nr:DNA sulfur modification protein DndD [Trichocoleus sp. FACHB-591]MBD2094469.1 DNA sulfur modification protein DndD [Trichocoleus sp. FACHB-591]